MTVAEVVKAEQRLADQLGRFEGQWVAIHDHTVVANESTLDKLLKTTKDEEIDVDSVLQVATDGDTLCFY